MCKLCKDQGYFLLPPKDPNFKHIRDSLVCLCADLDRAAKLFPPGAPLLKNLKGTLTSIEIYNKTKDNLLALSKKEVLVFHHTRDLAMWMVYGSAGKTVTHIPEAGLVAKESRDLEGVVIVEVGDHLSEAQEQLLANNCNDLIAKGVNIVVFDPECEARDIYSKIEKRKKRWL